MNLNDYIGKTIKVSYNGGASWRFYEVFLTDDYECALLVSDPDSDGADQRWISAGKPAWWPNIWPRIKQCEAIIRIVEVPNT
jgi:hypothetical protein